MAIIERIEIYTRNFKVIESEENKKYKTSKIREGGHIRSTILAVLGHFSRVLLFTFPLFNRFVISPWDHL
jgi:hypothetical protein